MNIKICHLELVNQLQGSTEVKLVSSFPTQIVCKPSMLTPIKYIFSEHLLDIDCIFGFCFNHIDHNKQRQQIVCDHDVGQLLVYLQTCLHQQLNFYVEFHL